MSLTDRVMDKLDSERLTDHGLLEYLQDVWATLEVPYKVRVETMFDLINQESGSKVYCKLEKLTKDLAQI